MRLLLIRHGQTPANVHGELDTAIPGPGLTRLGKRQARAVPALLAGEDIAGIYASRLVRTQQTALPLAQARGLTVQVRDGLHEIAAGQLERRSDWPSVERYLDVAMAWGLGELDRTMPGGTDGHEFFGRVDGAFAGLATEHSNDATVAVVMHSAAIRVWTAARAANIPPEFTAEHELGNGQLVIVSGTPQTGWKLDSWTGETVSGPETSPNGG